MVRIIIKGGVWKNTEDEVLKAAIAKYGKNQWARISSLLVRKTPKQCKARWYEWLDPSIKKTEWSKTEDEKLLHLAKLMPTQWRTIAPIVGRTATQCLERYQKLLDEAEAKENEELGLAGPSDHGPSADDIRKLRPGEIDPDPETKPARPDPIDMDEDEKEMLSEARARLANTQGKKAKRKARERQLEEARRLAVLQKKRELKAAGIIMRSKSKKKGMDYNADIPLEKKPAPGFYDTSDEQARVTRAPVGQSLRRLENKRKSDLDDADKNKRQRKEDGPHQTKFMPAREAQIQKLKEADAMSKRRKLMLPPAQVGEAELDDIVKIGMAGENAKSLVDGGSDASGRLLSDYEGLENAKMARTPRTAPQEDSIMAEARNLRNMSIQQTPLYGEENTPLHNSEGTGFDGATPKHNVTFTPNPLATPRTGRPGDPGATPHGPTSATPLRTPIRDSLSINPEDYIQTTGDTPREQRMRLNSAKNSLRAGFASLPKPENNFELLVPEDEDDAESDRSDSLLQQDASERDARLQRMQEVEEMKIYARRSQVVRLHLPRPPNVDVGALLSQLSVGDDVDEPQKLINVELAHLMQHDSIAFPIPGTVHAGATLSNYQLPSDEDLASAEICIEQELGSALGFPGADADQLREGFLVISKDEHVKDDASWWHIRRGLTYDSSRRKWVEPEALAPEERLAGYESQLAEIRESMVKSAAKAGKAEKKLGVQLGGYQARSGALGKRIIDGFDELVKVRMDLECFNKLKVNENVIGPQRVGQLKEEVERLETRERRLQERYKELDEERRDAQTRVEVLEEKMMAEAEELNDAALAGMEG